MLNRVAVPGVLLAVLGCQAVGADRHEDIDTKRYLEHVQLLASDGLQGRGNGTAGLELAADYVGEQFRQARLTPGGSDNSWFQPFEIVTGIEVGPGNHLALAAGSSETEFELGASYHPVSLSFPIPSRRPGWKEIEAWSWCSPATGSALPTSNTTTTRGSMSPGALS
jgi:hypothetical protein